MSSLLKDLYSKDFFDKFSEALEEVIPSFDKKKFMRQVFDENWENKELKQRMKHISFVLNTWLPTDFPKAAKYVKKIIESLRRKCIKESSVEYMFLPDYIETYGIEDYQSSVELIEIVTQFTSCEFAVRPFIIKYNDKMLMQMYKWSSHDNYHVRRLSSEGSRPRLPWAMALPTLKRDPSPILSILENLKNDSSEYVRRSVANSLNDISKDNPQIVRAIVEKWKGKNKETDAILKHASRTLLKQGDVTILKHFGLSESSKIVTEGFKVLTPKVKIGDSLAFSFSVQNVDSKPLKVRMEYGVYYLRNNEQYSKKVFKISERELKAKEKIDIERKQSFKIITTRTFYSGQHKLALIVNGVEKEKVEFELVTAVPTKSFNPRRSK